MSKLPLHFKIPVAQDRALIESYTHPMKGQLSCEYAFSNLLSWGELYQLAFCEKENYLWVYNGTEDYLYFPLGGDVSPERLILASQQMKDEGFSGVLDQVPYTYFLEHKDVLEHTFEFQMKEDFLDYVYSVDKLADLAGEKLSKKRNLIKQFEELYPQWSVRPLCGKEELSWISQFVPQWAAGANHEKGSVEEDVEALQQVFAYWDEGGFEGLVLLVENQPVAFAIYSVPTLEMSITHFEKALRDFKGASQMINRETARYLRPRIRWMNREQDLGVPGLRQAKRSYDPDYLIEVGFLIPKGK